MENNDWSILYRKENKLWTIDGFKCHHCNLIVKQYKTTQTHIQKCYYSKYSMEDMETMPIHKLTIAGKTYYRWGDQGKLYEKREDAEKQAQAAYAGGYKMKQKKDKK